MKNLFNMDSGLFRVLSRLADLMILNLLFIICCIPIVTIGASATALYYVTLKMAENRDSYIFRSFLSSFKQNFKQATILWLIVLAVGLLLGLDIYVLMQSDNSMMKTLLVIISATAIVYTMIVLYIFPILARFENKIVTILKNSFIMAIADFPRTILMMLITAGAVILTFWNSFTIINGFLLWILLGFAGIAYANSFFLKKVFAKYIPEETAENPDSWSVDETMPEEASAENSDVNENIQ